ncbi:MAG: hypothetical protein ABL955_15860, partial [Elusimicrobiota bacterium]
MAPRSAVAAAVVLAALCLPFSIAGTNAALGILTLALLLRARDGENRAAMLRAWRKEPLLGALAAYAVAGLICGFLGVDPAHSLRESPKDLHRLWAAALFLGAFALEDLPGLRPALALSFFASAIWGIGQTAYHALFVRLPLHPLARAQRVAVCFERGVQAELRGEVLARGEFLDLRDLVPAAHRQPQLCARQRRATQVGNDDLHRLR